MLSAKTTRRDFLKGTGILIVSFSLPSFPRMAYAQSATAGKTVALANKESLVVGGPLVTRLAHERRAREFAD